MKTFIIIDSHAVIHRAYHALPPLTTHLGEPINAVYGFTTMLLKILRELKPDYIAAAFDLAGPTFRHLAYERYKATRPETPQDLTTQFEKVREVLRAFRIPVFEKDGYEADDIIGTIAQKLRSEKKIRLVIVTGDMDALQLVSKNVVVYAMKKGITDMVFYDEHAVRERYGFGPELLIDYKGLRGDPSDNIVGVKGIGEKIASELIKALGTIEKIYSALKRGTKKISPSVGRRLLEGEEDAKISKELSRIHQDVPIAFDPSDARAQFFSPESVSDIQAIFAAFNFSSLLKRFEEIAPRGSHLETQFPSHTKDFSLETKEQRVKNPAVKLLKDIRGIQRFVAQQTKKPVACMIEGDILFLVAKDENILYEFHPAVFSFKKTKIFFEAKKDFFAYDAKSIIHFLRAHDIHVGGIIFDVMIAAWLSASYSRDFSYAGIAGRESGLSFENNKRTGYALFFELQQNLEKKIKKNNLGDIFYTIEMPMVRILADMEDRGVLLDCPFLKALGGRVEKALASLTKTIYKRAGKIFNINSPSQLSKILFEDLRIKTHGLRKTEKGGVISTRESELEKLKDADPIIRHVLQYRELMKLKTTYLDVLPRMINEKTGRLHTTFNQTGTSTGRLSSLNPNLQNIPILSDYGREIRKAIVAAPGFFLVSFDYSQIELRVAAHIANDKKMITAFKAGADIHALTASEINNISLDRVTPELRRAAKTLNFGVLYGMGSSAFSEATGMPKEDARKFIQEYFDDFSGIRRYVEETKDFVEDRGYVETVFGRRRYIPEIHSGNWKLKRDAERMAVNMPIQGTAADVVKKAMIGVEEWVIRKAFEKDARMLLQVHDELLFEIKKEILGTVIPEIKKIMEHAAILKVPLMVDVKVGKNWGEMEKYHT